MQNETKKEISKLCEKLGLKNEHQLASFFNIHQSTVISWAKKGKIPAKYKTAVDEFIKNLKIGVAEIEKISITPTDIAKELEVTPAAVSKMRTKNPTRYKRIEQSLKLQKAIYLSQRQ